MPGSPKKILNALKNPSSDKLLMQCLSPLPSDSDLIRKTPWLDDDGEERAEWRVVTGSSSSQEQISLQGIVATHTVEEETPVQDNGLVWSELSELNCSAFVENEPATTPVFNEQALRLLTPDLEEISGKQDQKQSFSFENVELLDEVAVIPKDIWATQDSGEFENIMSLEEELITIAKEESEKEKSDSSKFSVSIIEEQMQTELQQPTVEKNSKKAKVRKAEDESSTQTLPKKVHRSSELMGWIASTPAGGSYTKDERQEKIERYKSKRRNSTGPREKYESRQLAANRRPREGGRFMSKEAEQPQQETQGLQFGSLLPPLSAMKK